MYSRKIIGLILALGLLIGFAPAARGADSTEPEQDVIGQTPPRLSFADGQISFWRPGAQDWVQAQVNIPLAPGDQLSTGSPGNLELQIGARAFVRAWANTQVGLENQEPDFLQFKVTAGHASFDLRALESGRTVEVDTPNAAFTIEHPGYYRVNVTGERTSFITRRAGRATVIPASGEALVVAPSEEVVIEGTASPQVSSFVAPQLDDWDRWNYTRTDALLDAVSARYVSPGTYGASDLDRYGTWRVVDTYGSVWVPTGVPTGWAPYSTGSWTLDPVYGWTWVDTAPWGWAPYHYGRWVFVNGFWGWAPGPVLARPVYAPALVAFFGGPSVGVSVGIGGPVVGWVALGWGEPCVPWWGRPGFIHRPWWGGWGGPRVVNNVVVNNTTVVNAQNINVYRNANVRNAVVVVNEDRFGHGRIASARVSQVDVKSLQPIHTAPRVTPSPASFVPTANRGLRPPEQSLKRSVVATRPPHQWGESPAGRERNAGPGGVPTPAPRLVTVPQQREPASVQPRPPFGQSTVERPRTDRPQPPSRQKLEPPKRTERGPEGPPSANRQALPKSRPEPQAAGASPAAPPGQAGRPQTTQGAGPSAAGPQRPAERGQATATPGRESPRPQGKGAEGGPVATRQAPSQPASGPHRASPSSSAASRPPAPGVTAPPPPAGRPQAAIPQGRSLPGEPASRLAPNRAETKPPKQVERGGGPPQDRSHGAPEKAPRERPGG